MTIKTPFHAGELEAQRLAGESGNAERNSPVLSDSLAGGALAFLEQQRMVVLGTEAEDGAKWASVVFGSPGFVHPEDSRTVRFRQDLIRRDVSDVFWRNLRDGARMGMLAIDLATRRRLRVNGTVHAVDDNGFQLAVEEAYPNCPKYIQRRTATWKDTKAVGSGGEPREGREFSAEVAGIVDAADTLFVASGHAERGVDVSHRGGNAGFVRRLDAKTLRVPDYAGNSMFNTLGNLLLDPNAGVTVMDFAAGRMLQMTGRAVVEWDQPDDNGATGGTGRFWSFALDRWRILPIPVAMEWEFVDASPYNPADVRGPTTSKPE